MKTSNTFSALRKEFVGQRYSFDARTIVAIILHRMESYAAQCEKQGKTRTFSRFRVSRANMRRLLRKYRITDAPRRCTGERKTSACNNIAQRSHRPADQRHSLVGGRQPNFN